MDYVLYVLIGIGIIYLLYTLLRVYVEGKYEIDRRRK